MGNFQIKKSPTVYDAIVVGSGAGGGMAGYVLANAGLKVLMLEAGPYWDPKTHSHQLRWPWESPRRGAGSTRPLVNSTPLMVAGTSKDSPTPTRMVHHSIGFALKCLVVEPITGEEFLCALGLVILKEKAMME